ncbi:hypothetical protein RLIN73S_00210 [Rhodanobacter lindaniclasticus]
MRRTAWDTASWRVTGTYNHVSDSSYLYDYGNAMSHSPIYNQRQPARHQRRRQVVERPRSPPPPTSLQPELPRAVQHGGAADPPAAGWRGHQRGDVPQGRLRRGAARGSLPLPHGRLRQPGMVRRPRLAWRYTAYPLNDGYQNYGRYGRLGSTAVSPFTEKSRAGVPSGWFDRGRRARRTPHAGRAVRPPRVPTATRPTLPLLTPRHAPERPTLETVHHQSRRPSPTASTNAYNDTSAPDQRLRRRPRAGTPRTRPGDRRQRRAPGRLSRGARPADRTAGEPLEPAPNSRSGWPASPLAAGIVASPRHH